MAIFVTVNVLPGFPLWSSSNLPSKVAEGHPWIGQEVKGISEKSLQTFERPGKITDVLGDSQVEWSPDSLFLPWRADLRDVEFLPPLYQKGNSKKGKTSQADLAEVRMRIPALQNKLEFGEALTSEHIVLGDWLIHRDLARDIGAPSNIPSLVYPETSTYLSSEDPEIRSQCSAMIDGQIKKHGLVGVPIGSAGHWTLLVFRRSGGKEFKMRDPEFVDIRYYDSLKNQSKSCWEVATKIIGVLFPTVKEVDKFVDFRCSTDQEDGISCGLFLLHYWEGELRQFAGQGWVVGRPFARVVAARRLEIVNVTQELEQLVKDAGEVAKAKKGVKLAATKVAEIEGEGPRSPAGEDVMEFLRMEARRSLDVGLVPFYGCSRCRYSRGGCISWKCNPEKFGDHMKKFPEKYEGKVIRSAAWKSIGSKEFMGEK